MDKTPVVVVNNNNDIQKPKRYRKPRIPKSSINLKPTVEQKMRLFDKYTKPILNEYDIEDPNQKLVENLKNAFKNDVEDDTEPLPSFGYSNNIVNTIIRKNKNEIDNKLINDREYEYNYQLPFKSTASSKIARSYLAKKTKENYKTHKSIIDNIDKIPKRATAINFFIKIYLLCVIFIVVRTCLA